MDLLQSQIATLKTAAGNPDGRVIFADPNDGQLFALGAPGEGPIELGASNLAELVRQGLLSRESRSSCLITARGRRAIEG